MDYLLPSLSAMRLALSARRAAMFARAPMMTNKATKARAAVCGLMVFLYASSALQPYRKALSRILSKNAVLLA
jgi:hypothetical protein